MSQDTVKEGTQEWGIKEKGYEGVGNKGEEYHGGVYSTRPDLLKVCAYKNMQNLWSGQSWFTNQVH